MKLKKYTRIIAFIFSFIMVLGIVLNPISSSAKGTIIVVIDPGHGGGDESKDDTGAGAHYDLIGKNEKEINLITAQAMYDELSQYKNVKVYMTRDEDESMTIKQRLDFAKKKRADVFISCHYNASEYKRFYGSEIYTSAYPKQYAYSQSLAEYIGKEWESKGLYYKGAKTRLGEAGDYYGVIRIGHEYKIPALILEHGYLDNQKDVDLLGTESKWKEIGIADATAVAKFYGLSKEDKQKSVDADITVDKPEDIVEPDFTDPTNVKFTIDEYDMTTGEVKYTLEATENDSKLYLYGIDLDTNMADPDNSFLELSIWPEGKNSVSGTFMVSPGYEGSIAARVYNTYEKYTDSPLMSLMKATNVIGLQVEEAIPEPEAEEVTVIKNEDEKPMGYKLSVIGAVLALGALVVAIYSVKERKNRI